MLWVSAPALSASCCAVPKNCRTWTCPTRHRPGLATATGALARLAAQEASSAACASSSTGSRAARRSWPRAHKGRHLNIDPNRRRCCPCQPARAASASTASLSTTARARQRPSQRIPEAIGPHEAQHDSQTHEGGPCEAALSVLSTCAGGCQRARSRPGRTTVSSSLARRRHASRSSQSLMLVQPAGCRRSSARQARRLS